MEINRRVLLAGGAAAAAIPLLAEQTPACPPLGPQSLPEGAIILTAVVKAKPAEVEAVEQALRAMVEPTRKEEGCLCYNLHQAKSDKAQFMFYEQWASQEVLDRHMKTPHMAAMREKLQGKTEATGGLTFYALLR